MLKLHPRVPDASSSRNLPYVRVCGNVAQQLLGPVCQRRVAKVQSCSTVDRRYLLLLTAHSLKGFPVPSLQSCPKLVLKSELKIGSDLRFTGPSWTKKCTLLISHRDSSRPFALLKA